MNEDEVVDFTHEGEVEKFQKAEVKRLQLVNLPTGKPHISFSELAMWSECSYRHKKRHVDNVNLDEPGPALAFGTALHAACEIFLMSRKMDIEIALKIIRDAWEEHKNLERFQEEDCETWCQQAAEILSELPQFLDATFPDWEAVNAEEILYEKVDDLPHAFKGYIDAIIRAPGPKGKMLTWILDFKTSTAGWSPYKKRDKNVHKQIILYKEYWAKKHSIADDRDIRCGFLILKRKAKKDKHCELFKVSAGPKTRGYATKSVRNMLASVKRGVALKNRNSCRFCPYRDTEHCT